MSTATLHPVTRTCLNGWWDFQPVFGDAAQPDPVAIPQTDWVEGGLLVPSWWTKPKDAVRAPGERYFDERDRWTDITDQDEVLFDAYGYPTAWAHTRAGWVRRSITVAAATPGRRRWLVLEGVMPRAWVFINGVRVAHHVHPTLPLEVDIEAHLRPGINEVAVRIADYERDDRVNPHSQQGRMLTPTGNWIPCDHSGLWQDVWLEERSAVRVSGVTIRTSTRTDRLWVRWDLANDTDRTVTCPLVAQVCAWAKGADPQAQPALLHLPAQPVTIPAQGTTSVTTEVTWGLGAWWSPEAPRLHWLRSSLGDALHVERFGFREVWLEGKDLMLNDHPVHLFSDWGHKTTPFYLTEGWIRQWFGMMRDGNLNHSRLHTHPHPPLVLNLADEEGILITDEAGLHGSGGEQAADDPRYWERAEDHVRRFVARDRNRPSVILWSVENEMRWNRNTTSLTKEFLPRLRRLFNDLDPTRPAYHEGDSSLWPEGDQDLLSRHYGKECSGLGWWDERQPLHSGEMSLYHYSGPNNTCHLGGDATWAQWSAVEVAAAQDTAWIIEAGRTKGVSCFGPWNLSCLQNLRPHGEVRLTYADWSVPGAKPLIVHAHSSEFRFWEGGKGYTPDVGFPLQARAFRPLAVIDPCQRSGYVPGGRFRRTVSVVNDTATDIVGTLVLSLSRAGAVPAVLHRAAVRVARGRVAAVALDEPLAATLPEGPYAWSARLELPDGTIADGWSQEVVLSAPRCPPIDGLAVFGDGSSAGLWQPIGQHPRRLTTLDDLTGVRVLVLERGAVVTGINTTLAAFTAQGGRVLVLEQDRSVFPAIPLQALPVQTAFRRAPHHPILAGMTDTDLRFWGDDGYAQASGDQQVAHRGYAKGDGSTLLALCDSGEGSFGNGTMDLAPLIEVPCGPGVIVACQFLVTTTATHHPSPRRLLVQALQHLAAWQPATPVQILGEGPDVATLAAAARSGATVVVGPLDAAGLAAWSAATGVTLAPVDLPDTWQVVRVADHPLLDGLNQEDGCGVERWTYCGPQAQDHPLGRTFIAPAPGLECWWATPTEACLAEMFPHGGRKEPLRAHTRTRFLGAERPPAAVALGRIALGRGQVIIAQVTPPRTPDGALLRERHARLLRRVLANLGQPPASHPLAGTMAPPAIRSPGHPARLHVLPGPVDDALAARLIRDSRPGTERLLNRPILDHGPWQPIDGTDGRFPVPGQGERWLYLVIDTPVARQNVTTNLGVPNPEALTFADVTGDGHLTVILNGAEHAQVALPGTITDIPLEQGFNHLLLRWTGGGDQFGLHFRTIMRRAETEFAFP